MCYFYTLRYSSSVLDSAASETFPLGMTSGYMENGQFNSEKYLTDLESVGSVKACHSAFFFSSLLDAGPVVSIYIPILSAA